MHNIEELIRLVVRDELRAALKKIVLYAAPDGTQDDGDFVGFYVLPTGPIHKAIALLGDGTQPCGDPKDISRYQAHIQAECNRALAAQRQALRDEVMGAIGEDEYLNAPAETYGRNDQSMGDNPRPAPNLQYVVRRATRNVYRDELRTAISTIFESKDTNQSYINNNKGKGE